MPLETSAKAKASAQRRLRHTRVIRLLLFTLTSVYSRSENPCEWLPRNAVHWRKNSLASGAFPRSERLYCRRSRWNSLGNHVKYAVHVRLSVRWPVALSVDAGRPVNGFVTSNGSDCNWK